MTGNLRTRMFWRCSDRDRKPSSKAICEANRAHGERRIAVCFSKQPRLSVLKDGIAFSNRLRIFRTKWLWQTLLLAIGGIFSRETHHPLFKIRGGAADN